MKKWYMSKTIWTGVLFIIYGLLGHFGVIEVGSPTQAWIDQGLGVIMIILRFITKEPVIFKGKEG